MTIWYILYSFGTFFRLWYHEPRQIWQPWPRHDIKMLHAPDIIMQLAFQSTKMFHEGVQEDCIQVSKIHASETTTGPQRKYQPGTDVMIF
jgi:hypothetical protein